MPAQAFVDDSGGKGHTRHFVLAGLVGSSEAWSEFSNEWRFCLKQHPAISVFKMREAANCSGQFRGMTEQQRDEKLRILARAINRHPKLSTYSMIDLEAHAQTWATQPKPRSDPYFWPYQNTIMAVCHHLWDIGWREPFEIIFDENLIFGPRVKLWYPVIKRLMEIKYPEQATILPNEPLFRSDDEYLPLQAADMFAWCMRNATDKQDPAAFEWLLQELSNVQATDYSQYYDLERMKAVMDDAKRQALEGNVPSEIIEMHRNIASQTNRR
jgi:hypothetical protein